MHSPLTMIITLACTSGVLNLYLCVHVLMKRHHYTKIAYWFILYTGLLAIYCFASAFGLMATTMTAAKFWVTLQYVGIAFSAPIGLLFIMYYLGLKITTQRIVALLIIPCISFIMVATNDIHHFHYRIYEFDPHLGAPYIEQEIGIWYIIHGVFTFTCLLVAFLLVLFQWRETAKTYRVQLISLMCSQLIPMVTSFIYLMGVISHGIDPVPIVMLISSLLFLWSISSSRLFRIMPVTKDAIFNSINDGVIVLDEFYRLIEFNPACQKMFPQLDKSMFGKDIYEVWRMLSKDVMPFQLDTITSSYECQLELADTASYTYRVQVTLLQHSQNSKGWLIIFTDITELKMLQGKLENLAYYDELTQIYNRRAFFQQCNKEFEEAQRTSTAFSVILMDIDYFKKINDVYGHVVGDHVLVHVVEMCQSQLHHREILARYGGEEFVLALNDYTLVEGEALANRIRQHIETHPFLLNGEAISVTVSCGVAEMQEELTLYQLLNRADQALYVAKQQGRNRVQVSED
ncbi:histidine kinase N-terminal 7TM domain-containing diguanylate cyclase [Lysinibacillus piscis]|uniref:GGDEF domain-containing protein n=1 Tax=Lysinibacillus piscis TaxID=2518931 RepID=A0ABQ5NNX5_9BACI|nr:diguanylate cyclase [Lysinibacillus sp. KH24]GLC90039.1 GGDEF domain-containing protein [Lysinibacillus sp. KH24]